MGWIAKYTASITAGQTIIFEPFAKANSNSFELTKTIVSMVVEEIKL